MTDPTSPITLALRPKPPQPGTSRPGPDSGRGSLPPGLDPRVYDELKRATVTYDHLSHFGDPVEFWEAVRLARSNRGISESSDPAAGDNGLAEELQVIRRQLSPMVRDLRRFLQNVPGVPPAGEALEVSLGFLLASSREHQAVAKWLAESDKHLVKAASKLRGLYDIAAPYLEVLRPWTLDGPRTPLGGQAAAPGKAAPAEPEKPVVLQPDLLENFRRAFVSQQIFVETDLQAAFWESLMLNTAERLPCQTRLEQIDQARKTRQLALFHEEARLLHARLLPLRARHGRWVDALESFLRPLPGLPQDVSLFAMTLGFLVVEPGAMDRARRWLEDPEGRAKEAAAYVAGLARQVRAYLKALK